MLFVNGTQRKERIEICKNCPVYVATTGSCGQPLHRIVNPTAEPVTLDGVTFKPCGCFISAKATLKISDCPAGRWPKIVSVETRKKIAEVIQRYETNKFINVEDRKYLTELLRDLDPRYTPSSCPACVRNELKNLSDALNFGEYVDDVIDQIFNDPVTDSNQLQPVTEIPPTISKFQQPKKKRTRKPKK